MHRACVERQNTLVDGAGGGHMYEHNVSDIPKAEKWGTVDAQLDGSSNNYSSRACHGVCGQHSYGAGNMGLL